MSDTPLEVSIALPFSLDSTGNVAKSSTQEKIWADRVHAVIGTALAERIMRPEFGTRIPSNVFDGLSDTASKLKQEVNVAFAQFLDALVLLEVEVSEDPSQGQVSATITYQLPNRETNTTTVGLAVLLGNSPIYEEYPWQRQ